MKSCKIISHIFLSCYNLTILGGMTMNILTERRSIRKYDANYKIPRKELEEILQEAMRAPSSINMQPTRFFIIESAAYKKKLERVLYGNKMQLDTSSAMILMFTDLEKYTYTEKIFDIAVKKGLMPKEVRDRQIRNINNMVEDLNLTQTERTGVFDGGIMAMQLMLVAKQHGYDTCPIGGFKHDELADVVGIDKNRYKALHILSIGKADEAGYESVRLDVKDVAKFL
jgi:nitroreductase